jgi:hypothetical protein
MIMAIEGVVGILIALLLVVKVGQSAAAIGRCR